MQSTAISSNSMEPTKLNHGLFVGFIEVLECEDFNEIFKILALENRHFKECKWTASAATTIKLVQLVVKKAESHSSPLKNTIFA